MADLGIITSIHADIQDGGREVPWMLSNTVLEASIFAGSTQEAAAATGELTGQENTFS